MTKITGIIILCLACVAAIFCLMFKIKVRPELYDRKTLKARFLVAISIMMAFFAGFFTSCKSAGDQVIAKDTTPSEISVPVSDTTPEYVPTPSKTPSVEKTPFVTCYLVGPLDTPKVDPNVPMPTCYVVVMPSVKPDVPRPTCYTVVPHITPSATNIPSVKCYRPAVLPTPSPTPFVLCYEAMELNTPAVPTCYKPVPMPTSYNSDSELLNSKLALIEEISKKNTVKEDILNRVKMNILSQKNDA